MAQELAERQESGRSPIAWTPKHELTLEQWSRQGRQLVAIGQAAQWWIGDWLNYGATRYGEKYSRALRSLGYEYSSLRDLAYVAGRIEVSRRRDSLSFSHHREVAPLEVAEQAEWLKRAQAESWSVGQLREALREQRSPESPAQRAPAPDPPAAAGETGLAPISGEVLESHTVRLVLRIDQGVEQHVAELVSEARTLGFEVVDQRID